MTYHFGFDSETDFNEWVSREFDLLGVKVEDFTDLKVQEVTLDEDGCCEICWYQDVEFRVEYKGNLVSYRGTYVDDGSMGGGVLFERKGSY